MDTHGVTFIVFCQRWNESLHEITVEYLAWSNNQVLSTGKSVSLRQHRTRPSNEKDNQQYNMNECKTYLQHGIVDGRNPAPPGMYKTF